MSETFIILTAAAADLVRGETSPGAWLEPVPLDAASWALPERVLTDPAHGAKWGMLSALPRRLVETNEWPGSSKDG